MMRNIGNKLLRAAGVGAALTTLVAGMTLAGVQTAGATSAKLTLKGTVTIVATMTMTSTTANNHTVTVNPTTGNFKTTAGTGGMIRLHGKFSSGTLSATVTAAVKTGKSTAGVVTGFIFSGPTGPTISLAGTLAGTTYNGCVIALGGTINFKTVAGKLVITPVQKLTPVRSSVAGCIQSNATTLIQAAITYKYALTASLTGTV
jgi:hypothetical protein